MSTAIWGVVSKIGTTSMQSRFTRSALFTDLAIFLNSESLKIRIFLERSYFFEPVALPVLEILRLIQKPWILPLRWSVN
jgi:hypothetical protein